VAKMIKIRPEQYQTLEDALSAQLLDLWVAKVRGMFPSITSSLPDEKLREMVRHDMETGRAFKIEPEDELWRYVCLRFKMQAADKSEFHLGIVGQVVQNTDWPATKRLDFIDRYVLDIR
jgi:hypothetical protein